MRNLSALRRYLGYESSDACEFVQPVLGPVEMFVEWLEIEEEALRRQAPDDFDNEARGEVFLFIQRLVSACVNNYELHEHLFSTLYNAIGSASLKQSLERADREVKEREEMLRDAREFTLGDLDDHPF